MNAEAESVIGAVTQGIVTDDTLAAGINGRQPDDMPDYAGRWQLRAMDVLTFDIEAWRSLALVRIARCHSIAIAVDDLDGLSEFIHRLTHCNLRGVPVVELAVSIERLIVHVAQMKRRDRLAVLAGGADFRRDFDHYKRIRGSDGKNRIGGLRCQPHQRRVIINPRHCVFTASRQQRTAKALTSRASRTRPPG